MQYHLFLTCQRKHAKALFTALSTRYRVHLPQIVPLHYGATHLDEGFVAAAWHGAFDPDAFALLVRDPRILDAASYPVAFFEHAACQEEDEEEEQVLTRLYGPPRWQASGSGEEDGR